MISLALLHQTGALSYEKTYGILLLVNRVSLDKLSSHMRSSSNIITSIDLNNVYHIREVFKFTTNLVSLCIDSYVTSTLTGFKSDFTESLYYEIEECSSDTTTGKITIISEDIIAYKLKDDNFNPFMLLTKISYTLESKFRLMLP